MSELAPGYPPNILDQDPPLIENAIVGGAKVSTKLDLLGNLLSKVEVLVIGGGMANTFLHAQGIAIGKLPDRPIGAGQELVDNADVDGIVFTGSKDVGMHLIRDNAARPIPRPDAPSR